MFERFIHLMSEGKTYSWQELSCELDVSEDILQGFIEHLSKEGLLMQVDFQQETTICSSHCTHCKGCEKYKIRRDFKNTPTLWAFKED